MKATINKAAKTKFTTSHRKEGKTKDEIAEVLQKINLPIDIHLAVFGHFSEICKHGKILKK